MKQQPMARKLLALCLSLLLVLALSPTAWADPTEGGETPAPTETAPANTAPAEEETTTTNETPEETTTYVAQIGGQSYATLAEAFEKVKTGETIKILADIEEMEETILLNADKSVTLDLGGHRITGAANYTNALFSVTTGTLTVNHGTITAEGDAFKVQGDISPAQSSSVSAKLILGSDLSVTAGWNCIWIAGKGAVADVSADLAATGEYAVIQGNGIHNDEKNNGGTEIIIREGANVIHSNGETSCAIYMPQDGILTVEGGTIQGGGMGIGIKSGTLNISGGEIIATGDYVAEVAPNGNGINASGSAITIDSNGAYVGQVKINITGGTISSETSPAVREVGSDDELVSIGVSENAVLQSGVNGESDIEITNDKTEGSKVSVTGGTFSKNVADKYIDDSTLVVQVDDDGKYYVGGKAQEKIESATTSVKVENGTSVSKVPANVEVTNNTNNPITVNDEPVSEGESTKIPEPEQPSKPSTPSFTEPEYYPDYDEDVDYLPPVDEEEPEETEDLYMVTCRTLNVRLGGGTGYAKIGTLSRGTVVSGELENGWLKFVYDGGTAYCSADYLAKIDGDLTDMHVTCRTLNVRAGAGTNFEILGTLSRGTEVEILDVLNGWYKIEYLGGEAYVSAAYIG